MKFFQIASIFIALLFASGHAAANRISATRMFRQKKQVSHLVSHKALGTKSHTEVSPHSSQSKITASNGTQKSGTKSTNKKVSVNPKKSHKSKSGTTTTRTRYMTKMIKKPKTVMISNPKTKLVTKKKPELATKPWSKVITKSWARMISKPAPKLPSDTLYWPYRDNQSKFIYDPVHNHRLGGIYSREGPTGPLYSHTTPIGSLYPTHDTFFASPHPDPTSRDLRGSPKKPASQPLKKTVLSLQISKAGLLHESTIINQDL